MLSCWGSVCCRWLQLDIRWRFLLCGFLSGETVPCCSPSFHAMLAWPEVFPEPRLSPWSLWQDWCWGGVPEPCPFLTLVPSSAPGAALAAVALAEGAGHWCAGEAACGYCGSSAERWTGAVWGDQCAQGSTNGPMRPGPAHCVPDPGGFMWKSPWFPWEDASFVTTTERRD